MSSRNVYRVSYSRRGWQADTRWNWRYFSRRHDAERFLEKILSGGRPELAPIVEWSIQHTAAQWETIDEWSE